MKEQEKDALQMISFNLYDHLEKRERYIATFENIRTLAQEKIRKQEEEIQRLRELYETERAMNDMIGVEREEWAKKFEQQAKELEHVTKIMHSATADNERIRRDREQLREQLNKAVKKLKCIAMESSVDGAGRNLGRCNMYANEIIDELTGRNSSSEVLSLLQGKEQKQ